MQTENLGYAQKVATNDSALNVTLDRFEKCNAVLHEKAHNIRSLVEKFGVYTSEPKQERSLQKQPEMKTGFIQTLGEQLNRTQDTIDVFVEIENNLIKLVG